MNRLSMGDGKKYRFDPAGDVLIRFAKAFWIFCFMSWPAAVAWGESVEVLTTTWTPYVYTENGKTVGMGTQIVRAILARAGVKGNIQNLSWNRAILIAQKQKNIMIYPLMRIEQRENQFIWVAPLFDAQLSLFRLRENNGIAINHLADAKAYTIGVLKGAAMHRFLLSQGFEDNKQLHIFYNNRKSIEMLFRGRVDLVADNPLVVTHEIRQLIRSHHQHPGMAYSRERIEEVFPLIRRKAYMAFGKGSSPGMVARMNAAWKELASDGDIQKIISRYE